MKITIENIEINNEQLDAIISIKGHLREVNDFNSRYDIQRSINEVVVNRLAEKILLDRGPDILAKIQDNQIINALIMRVAGSLKGDR